MNQRPVNDNAVDPDSGPLSERDRLLLAEVERSRDRGRDLEKWWGKKKARFAVRDPISDKKELENEFKEVFRLMRPPESNEDEEYNFAFYDSARIGDRDRQVIGSVQQMFFDRPKEGARISKKRWLEQLEVFVFRYLMRVSDWKQPILDYEDDLRPLARFLQPFSMRAGPSGDTAGFNYRQIYYRLGDGKLGKYKPDRQEQIIDLQRIKKDGNNEEDRQCLTDLQWVVLRLDMEDYALKFQPPARKDLPFLTMPLVQRNHVILSPELIKIEEGRDDLPHDLIAAYRIGYTMLHNVTADHALEYGPAKFETAFSVMEFLVREDLTVLARVVHVVELPDKTFNIPINPADWGLLLAEQAAPDWVRKTVIAPMRDLAGRVPLGRGFDPFLGFANTAKWLSFGFTDRVLGVSRRQVEKLTLAEVFRIHRGMLLGLQHLWRKVADWQNPPDWVGK